MWVLFSIALFTKFIVFANFPTLIIPLPHFVNNLRDILPKLTTFPKFAVFAKFVNISSPFFLGWFICSYHFVNNMPNLPTFLGPASWIDLLAHNISSATLKLKYRQSRHSRQIRQHFWALPELIYSLITFRQQPWWNFAKIATFAEFAVFANISGPFLNWFIRS